MLISYQDIVYQVYAVCMFTVCVCGFVIMGTDCISLSLRFFFTVCCPDNTFGPTCQGNRILLLIPLSPFSLSLPSLSFFPLSLFLLPPSFFSLSLFLLPPSFFLPSLLQNVLEEWTIHVGVRVHVRYVFHGVHVQRGKEGEGCGVKVHRK